MADPVVDTLDADLAAIMTPPAASDATSVEPKLGEPQADAVVPPQADAAPDATLAALDTIEEPKADDAPKSTLTPDQERIFALIPNVQVAEAAAQTAQNYNNFTSTFERGDYANVEAMLEAWNPAALEGFLEHIYNKRVASGEWVDRWIADKEGNPSTNKAVTRLERQIQQLQSQLQGRQTKEQQDQQQAQATKVFADYTAHIDKLFDTIKFSAGDRKPVAALLKDEVRDNAQVRQAIMAGNLTAVNSLFKRVVREYVDRDKAAAAVKEGILKGQEGKKPLLQAAPQPSTVAPGSEEEFDQQLNDLFATAGKKKR